MSFIVTSDGNELNMLSPQPGHITASSIAHSLAQINRFNGHARRPYSVAEHSLLVCEIAEREHGLCIHGQFAALMHDAHEAYCGDVATPAKPAIGCGWLKWERHWEKIVQCSFSILVPSYVNRAAIKAADLAALATERRDLMPATPTPWAVLDGIEPIGWVDLMDKGRCAMEWSDWRAAFLDKHDELDFGRNLLMQRMAVRNGAPA